jgi:WD40 repeat protein
MAVSSMNGMISVLDTRISSKTQKGVVYKVAVAHSGAVSCARFSPFVPYWLASAGQDGAVKLWDLVLNIYNQIEIQKGSICTYRWTL